MNAPLCRLATQAAQRGLQQPARMVSSYTTIVSSPPQVRISFPEKIGHGCLLFLGVLGYPLYAITKVAAAKKEEYEALEIPEEWANYKA